MDRKQIESEHIVARYLADQLSPSEAAQFEAYYTQHPGMVREIEYTLRLKEGLATLRDRGQLDALASARPSRWGTTLCVAAVIVAALIGAWTWLGSSGPVMAATVDSLEVAPTTPIAGRYLLVRTRTTGPVPLKIPMPRERSLLEFQMLPSSGAEGAPYRVLLSRLGKDGHAEQIADTGNLLVGEDGLVTTWIDSGKIKPGYHTLKLLPAQADPASPPTDRFVIDLR